MRVQRTDCREPLLLSRYRQCARMTASKPFTWMRVQRRRSKFFAPRKPSRLRRGRFDGGRYARRLARLVDRPEGEIEDVLQDRKSTRLNSSHGSISYAV